MVTLSNRQLQYVTTLAPGVTRECREGEHADDRPGGDRSRAADEEGAIGQMHVQGRIPAGPGGADQQILSVARRRVSEHILSQLDDDLIAGRYASRSLETALSLRLLEDLGLAASRRTRMACFLRWVKATTGPADLDHVVADWGLDRA